MECKQWNETWVAYLYDECSAEERDIIAAHLDRCDGCRERMNELAATREVLASSASEIAAPPRVIVLPAASPRTPSTWSFAGGFAAAAAMFAIGLFVGVTWFTPEPVEQTILEMGEDPIAVDRGGTQPDPNYLQIRNEYEQLDNRLGRIENWLPESQGDSPPALATWDRVQSEVGTVRQQLDLRRSEDLRLMLEWILAADQESRLRDARTLQTLGIVHATTNPNVRER
ncbi:MAG: hypothetical protein GTN89_07975 [Acidobacteria bacterium]|nr:hypothetical protein [Acidobacteriota bacterium]NIM63680.1 hypothetical protein [Acidobacteriota bacterium]NIO59283.1 hypothetical protein [Acidobacteriota bacterium]NIQ30295.1 hypothetical protein [Acidobacteriota bacterium]NIQ85238.1 hypothetical protein [Acidobacteriota bacterium]